MNETEGALKRAHAAAERGDPKEMLEEIAITPLLDGIVRQIRGRWQRLPADLIEDIVGDAVDQLYEKIRTGGKISNIPGFLVKTAQFMAVDLYADLITKDEFEPDNIRHLRNKIYEPDFDAEPSDEPGDEPDYDAQRRIAIEAARRLLPQLGQANIQNVMEVIIDAVESGREDISNTEIAEITGLETGTVATLKHRGFKRLTTLSEKEGLANTLSERLAEWTALEEDH